jgi:toxin ParE1/3/4
VWRNLNSLRWRAQICWKLPVTRDNPQRARSFVAELRQQCVLLAEQSGLAVAKPELAEGLRVLPYGRYLIFFSVTELGILIERVLHSARNFSSMFDHSSDSA